MKYDQQSIGSGGGGIELWSFSLKAEMWSVTQLRRNSKKLAK